MPISPNMKKLFASFTKHENKQNWKRTNERFSEVSGVSEIYNTSTGDIFTRELINENKRRVKRMGSFRRCFTSRLKAC